MNNWNRFKIKDEGKRGEQCNIADEKEYVE